MPVRSIIRGGREGSLYRGSEAVGVRCDSSSRFRGCGRSSGHTRCQYRASHGTIRVVSTAHRT
eukprot:3868440-Rhodomonas_salina.2